MQINQEKILKCFVVFLDVIKCFEKSYCKYPLLLIDNVLFINNLCNTNKNPGYYINESRNALRNETHFVTQAATHQVSGIKNVPSESARFSAVRSQKSYAIRLEIRYLGVAQLVARYLGVVEAASSSLVTQTK